MDGIRDALLAKFGDVPILEAYRQMAIGQQKLKDWQQAIFVGHARTRAAWRTPARSLDDLRKRLTAYQAKLAGAVNPAGQAAPKSAAKPTNQPTGLLICEAGAASFERVVLRGRKPKNCPCCR